MTNTETWLEHNQRGLTSAISGIRTALERHAARGQAEIEPPVAPSKSVQIDAPQLNTLVSAFSLSPFERDVLLLCAAIELDASFGTLCAKAHGDPTRTHPTFGLALGALSGAHWSALSPFGPLRRWRLIETRPGGTITTSALNIDERILNYLAGVSHLDLRLSNLLEPARSIELVPSQLEVAERIATTWSHAARNTVLPIVQITGTETLSVRAVAANACERLNLKLATLPAALVPTDPSELETLIRLWEREVALAQGALLVDCFALDHTDTRTGTINRLLERINGPIMVAGQERRRDLMRSTLNFDVKKPDVPEQRGVWQAALGLDATIKQHIDPIVAQFNLDASRIRAVASDALARIGTTNDIDSRQIGRALWDACRMHARPTLEGLAQRIDGAATWEDLVLPNAQRHVLADISKHVQHRGLVYERWGFGGRNPRGLGITALFAGASGTGKTTAAEVLAHELELDLYRIDLSSTVSKYIGETEKNLARIFDAAEAGGAILLFDEADSLFGKRSEVKDSHDRYANLEVSYLLQRMEAYSGLAILTTNIKSALDTAFLRRIRFIVQFPFPDPTQREEIWRRVFPRAAPTKDLDYKKLAQLAVSGGSIRNIALSSAFFAADEGVPICMEHILQAANAEYAKQERVITEAEVRGWLEDEPVK